MIDKYVTHEELLDILQCVQDGVLENSTTCKNLTFSMMELFKCLEHMDNSAQFKAAMYDVLESLERNLSAGERLNEQTNKIVSKIRLHGQKE
ncbi:MAG: hypothetical protein R8M45_09615 [Ghiorsea sp.]